MLQSLYYLAYGSNLNLKEMEKRCPSSIPVGKTILNGYKLEFRKYLNVTFSRGDTVPVGIFKIDATDIDALDKYEDYPILYRKEYVEIELYGQKTKALIYIMNENSHDKNEPDEDYLDICKSGYDDFGFDKAYLEEALKDLNEIEIIKN